MNMTSVLHRTSRSAATRHRRHPTSSTAPPSVQPRATAEGDGPRSWPTSAKVLVAILVVAAVLGAVGVAAAVTSTDDGSTERQLQDRVASLTRERDEALDTAAKLDTELVTVRQQLQAAQVGNGELTDQVAELEARIETLTAQRAETSAAAAALTATVAELEATVADLERSADVLDAALQTADRRLAAAIAERDALAELFPMKFDASLVDVDMLGDHDVALAQVHCTGVSSCGKVPAIDELRISRTPQGWLWLVIPGYVEGGLSRTGGALHMVAHSTTALPSCAGVPRQAEITMTLFPGGYQIADDGDRAVVGVGAVMTVEAPAVGECPAALAFYSVELT